MGRPNFAKKIRRISRTSRGGAGGNRTLVRRAVDVRATTIPENAPRRLAHRRVGGAREGARRQVFPWCQRSFPPSAVSPCRPPLLLLPGCSGLAPCAVSGHESLAHLARTRRRRRTARCRQLFWVPRLRSLSNSGRTVRRAVTTSKPISPVKGVSRNAPAVRGMGDPTVPTPGRGPPFPPGQSWRPRRASSRATSRWASRSAIAWRLS